MTTGKIPNANAAAQMRVQADNAATAQLKNAAQIAASDHHVFHKGTPFAHGTPSSPMRRGPTLRLPLQSAGKRIGGSKKSRKSKHADAEFGAEECHDERHTLYDFNLEGRDPTARVTSLEDRGDDDSDDGKKRENSVDHRFKMSAVAEQSNAVSKDSFSKDSYAVGRSPEKSAELKLPPLQSMSDVVKFLHASTQNNKTDQSSLHILMQRVSSAILRMDIKLPNKIADARNVLIDVFGVGYTGTAALPESMRTFHRILPLLLVNLSRTRTSNQQALAAARMESQTKAFKAG